MPSRQKTSSRRVEPRLKMSCHTLVSCASNPEAKDRVTAGQVLDALVAGDGWPSGPTTESTSPKQKRRMSRSWMECSMRHPPPAWATSARHCRGVRALNGEVLVVAEDRGHRRAQRPAVHEVAERPEDRRAAQHEAALARHAGGVDGARPAPRRGRRSTSSGFSQKTAQPGGEGLVDRAPMRRRRRADPDGVAAPGHLGRVGRHGHRCAPPRASAKARARRSRGVVDGHDRRLDHAAVDHRLEAQAVGPGDEAGPDEADRAACRPGD